MISVTELASAIEPTLIRQITDRAGPSSLHLGLGQPDLPMSKPVRDAIAAFAADGAAPYSPNLGTAACRRAVAAHEGAAAEEVMVTCGVQEALAVAIFGLVERGGEVLVPDPGFPAYANLVRAAGAEPVPYRLGAGWRLDPDAVVEAAGPKTTAMVLNTPSNPTGAVHAADDLEEVLGWCAEHDVTWISDEIYEDFTYDGPHVSARDFPASCDQGVKLSGLSKSHAMMGLRLGWLIGPAETIERLKPLHQHLVTCAPTVSQRAAIAALGSHGEIVASARTVFRERRDRMMALAGAIPGISFAEPAGAFYLLLDVSQYADAEGGSLPLSQAILSEVDVVTIPGRGFGEAGEGHLRLAYTVGVNILEEAMERLTRFFEGRSRRTG